MARRGEYTFAVTVSAGRLEVEGFKLPALAPTPQGHERPLRTVAEVKSYARACVAYSGWDRGTKRAAREEIQLLTREACEAGVSVMF